MLNLFSTILPVFLLIGLGYFAVQAKLLKVEAIGSIGNLVLYFFLPATMFAAVSRIDFGTELEVYFLLAYGMGSLAVLLGGLLFSRWVMGADASAGAIRALGMSIPNSMFIGYPILILSFDPVPTIAFVMAVIVENLLILPIVLVLLEYGAGQQQGDRRVLRQQVWKMIGLRIAKNPLIGALVAGVLVSVLDISLPKPINQTIEMLARTSAAIALCFVGATLAANPFRAHLEGVSSVVVGKLLAHPLLVALCVWLLPPFAPDLQKAVIIMAAVPMMAIYPILGERYGYRAFCASALLVTTIAAFFSLALVLGLVGV